MLRCILKLLKIRCCSPVLLSNSLKQGCGADMAAVASCSTKVCFSISSMKYKNIREYRDEDLLVLICAERCRKLRNHRRVLVLRREVRSGENKLIFETDEV